MKTVDAAQLYLARKLAIKDVTENYRVAFFTASNEQAFALVICNGQHYTYTADVANGEIGTLWTDDYGTIRAVDGFTEIEPEAYMTFHVTELGAVFCQHPVGLQTREVVPRNLTWVGNERVLTEQDIPGGIEASLFMYYVQFQN